MLLISTMKDQETKYYLVEMLVDQDQDARVKVLHPITCYSAPAKQKVSRARLWVSRTQPVAFVLFDTAVVMFSLVKIRESPSSQLLLERHELPEPFQDCIRFQESSYYRVLGSVLETSDKQAALLFGVQGFGMVKVVSRLRGDEEVDVEEADDRDRISAKSKIEQAVFFGTNRQNPLDFNKADHSFSREELEAAAMEITSEILSSSSKHLPKSEPSIEAQMRLRAKALEDLAEYLMAHYSALISRPIRFQLMLEAEKLAAAQAIWKIQEEIQRKYPQADREMPYLDFTLRALHESRQKYPDPDKGEKDRVRHWLVNSVKNVGHLMSELVSCIPELEPMDVTDPKVVADYLKEAVDLWSASYTAVFKFREDNARSYGLGDEVFKDGVLQEGFPVEIPHPWSSSPEPLRFGQRLIYDVCKFLDEWWEVTRGKKKKSKMPTDEEGKPYEPPSRTILNELAARLPAETELFSRLVFEESIQAKAHLRAVQKDPEALKDELKNIDREVQDRLGQALQAISMFNIRGAIDLGEKLEYYGDLVTMHYEYYKQLLKETAADPSLTEKNQHALEKMRDRAESYYTRFGKGWAFAVFSQMLIDGESGTLLAKGLEDKQKEEFLTWFFKIAPLAQQDLGKLGWIHDIISNNDFHRAEATLSEVAAQEQGNVWDKQTELALAKLAGLAAAEGAGEFRDQKGYDDGLAMLTAQGHIFNHVMGSVGAALDDKAAVELAQETFAVRVVAKSPALKRRLKQLLRSLLQQTPLTPAELVDLLTLMDPVEWAGLPEEDPEVSSQEFVLALGIVNLSGLSNSKKEDLRTSIWRRTMIRDDWLVLNETSGKDDQRVEEEMQQSSLFRALQHVLYTETADGTPANIMAPGEILQREAFPASLQDMLVENEVEGIRKDVEKEQARLKSFVDKGRLEDHFGGLVTSAQRSAREILDAHGEQLAQLAAEQAQEQEQEEEQDE
jgi:nuclear pore complex protein Nup133